MFSLSLKRKKNKLIWIWWLQFFFCFSLLCEDRSAEEVIECAIFSSRHGAKQKYLEVFEARSSIRGGIWIRIIVAHRELGECVENLNELHSWSSQVQPDLFRDTHPSHANGIKARTKIIKKPRVYLISTHAQTCTGLQKGSPSFKAATTIDWSLWHVRAGIYQVCAFVTEMHWSTKSIWLNKKKPEAKNFSLSFMWKQKVCLCSDVQIINPKPFALKKCKRL